MNVVFKSMKYCQFPKNTVVFRYGDKGDLYYVILKGYVSVKIPIKNEVQMNDYQFLEMILSDKDIVNTGDKSNPSDKIFDYLKQYGPEKSLLRFKPHKEIKSFSFVKFAKVHEMGDGKGFGEIALQNDNPRSATITCEQDTEFVTISKQAFKQVLLTLQD